MNRFIACLITILLSALLGSQQALGASCIVYAIERPKDDNYFNENTRIAVKAEGNTVVEFKDLTDLRDKIAQHMSGQGCDCMSELILGGHGQPGRLSVGCGAYKSCKKNEYIGKNNYAEWTPVMADIGNLMCDGLISEGIRLWGCQVGVCSEASQLLHDIAQITATPVHAPTITVMGSEFLDQIYSNNWQIGLPNAPARQPCKLGTVIEAENRTRGAGTFYQCPCDSKLYENVGDCTNGCTVSLGCFTNICEKVYDNTYLDSYDGNPVLTGGEPLTQTLGSFAVSAVDSWDAGGVSTPTVIKDDDGYKMWFTGYDATDVYWRIGLAESPYGDRWTKAPQNPVLIESPKGAWDDDGNYNPSVIKDGSVYKMWYQGFSEWSQIGYAESSDGIAWSKHPAPVLTLGPTGSPDEYGAGYPSVLKVGNTYKMWYGCYDGWQWRTCLATSPDGIAWSRHANNPVVDVGPDWAWDEWYASAPSVEKVGNYYVMYYSGMDWYEETGIGRATSRDGIHWKKDPDNPVIPPNRRSAWESGGTYNPSILYDEDEALMKLWYRGKDTDGGNYAVGFASLHLIRITQPMPWIPLLLLDD